MAAPCPCPNADLLTYYCGTLTTAVPYHCGRHPDVQFFNVIDKASDEHVASFYLDPYARPEDKRGGAWMGVCVGKSQVLDKKPVAYLTCNGSPPADGKPSLMTFNEVAARPLPHSAVTIGRYDRPLHPIVAIGCYARTATGPFIMDRYV